MIVATVLLTALLTDGEGGGSSKIASAKSLLAAFDVRGPLRLQVFSVPQDGNDRYGGMLVLSDRAGDQYTVYFKAKSDRARAVFKGREGAIHVGFKTHPLANKALVHRVQGWAAHYYGVEEVRLDSIVADDQGVGHASFSILRNGYPFVDPEVSYGYDLVFTIPDGKFVSFYGTDAPPPVETERPVLTEDAAVKTFQHIFDTQLATKAMADHKWFLTYKLMGGRKLGYMMPQGASKARLVWMIPYMQIRDVGYAKQGGGKTMLIDAVTGRQVMSPALRDFGEGVHTGSLR